MNSHVVICASQDCRFKCADGVRHDVRDAKVSDQRVAMRVDENVVTARQLKESE